MTGLWLLMAALVGGAPFAAELPEFEKAQADARRAAGRLGETIERRSGDIVRRAVESVLGGGQGLVATAREGALAAVRLLKR